MVFEEPRLREPPPALGRPHPRVRVRDRIAAFDIRADALAERVRSPAADRVFYGLSSAADHGLLWLSIGAWRAALRRDPAQGLRLGIAMGAESALTNGVVKQLFRRVRPPHHIEDGPLPMGMHRPLTSSFPSGHAASAFTAASLLSRGTAAAPLWFTLAALVAWSRVYVKMHHTSDVLAGAALGLAFGRIAGRLLPLEPRRDR